MQEELDIESFDHPHHGPINGIMILEKKCILGFLQVILSCFYKGINEVTKFLKIMVDDEEFMTCATKQKIHYL